MRQYEADKWHEWTSHLAHLGPNGGMGEEGRIENERERTVVEREALPSL